METVLPLQTAGDLTDLFDELRRSGYCLDASQLAAAQRLLLSIHSSEPNTSAVRLKTILAPVFVSSAAQQKDFYRRFDAWMERRKSAPIGHKAVAAVLSPDEEVQPERQRRWQLITLATLVVLTLIVGSLFWSRMDQPDFPETNLLEESTNRTQSAPARTQDPALEAGEPSIDYSALRLALVTLPFAVFAIWLGVRWVRRRRWLGRWSGKEVPELEQVRLPRGRIWLFASPSFHSTAQNLRRHSRVMGADLDIARTVDRSIENAGLFTPVAKKQARIPEYLFLIEEMTSHDHVARFSDEILNRIHDEGVAVERCYFFRDPRFCFRNDAARTPISINELSGRAVHHRLILIGTADGFFHPVTGQLEKWVFGLESWPARVILSPRPICHWTTNELTLLENGFSLGTVTPSGIRALADSILDFEETPEGMLLEGSLVAPTSRSTAPVKPQTASEIRNSQ